MQRNTTHYVHKQYTKLNADSYLAREEGTFLYTHKFYSGTSPKGDRLESPSRVCHHHVSVSTDFMTCKINVYYYYYSFKILQCASIFVNVPRAKRNNETLLGAVSSNVKEIRGTPPKFFKLLSNWRHLFDNDVIISSGPGILRRLSSMA